MVILVLNVPVLLVVFEEQWERGVAFCLLTLLFAANIVHEVLAGAGRSERSCFTAAAVFLAFAVAVILKRIFQRQAIRTDDVIGALCGYLLAAVAWGNAYALVYVLWPESFRIADVIAWRLGDWHLQRFLFSYFSVMTLTTMGYGDITPRAHWFTLV